MDLKELVLVLWRKKWILIIVPFISAIFTFAFRYKGEWEFKSTSQLSTGLTVTDQLVGNSKYLNPYEVQVTFTNLIETIKSRSVISLVSYKLTSHDLADSTKAFRKLKPKAIKKGKLHLSTEEISYSKLILKNKLDSISLLNLNDENQREIQKLIDAYNYDYETIIKNLKVSRLNQSDFIEISYISEHPQLSAYIVNTVCSEFIRYYYSLKESKSNLSIQLLESIVNQRRQYLEQKTQELQDFKSTYDILNSSLESEARIRQIEEYKRQILAEQQRIRGLELTLSNLESRINEADNNSPSTSNSNIIYLRRKIGELNERYIKDGQTNQVLLDSLKMLRSELENLLRTKDNTNRITSEELNDLKRKKEDTRVELSIANENLKSIQNIYNSIKYDIGDFTNKESMGNALIKEVEIAREEYTSAQNKLNDAKEKLITGQLNITQVLIAEPAEQAESKKTLLFTVFGGVLSFGFCSIVILGLHLADTKIRNAERFINMTRLKLAGTFSKVDTSKIKWDEHFYSSEKNFKGNEEIRKIRFELTNTNAKVILLTSIQPNQGKTFMAVAIAYSFSLFKKKVLIIDCNVRNNSLTNLFSASSNLTKLIEDYEGEHLLESHNEENENGSSKAKETTLITRTQNPYIDIIGNRKSALSPLEVVSGSNFKTFIEWLKVKYDYIIIEAANLENYSDSKELFEFVDVIIPIFSADSKITNKDKTTINYLKTQKNKLGPAILNMVHYH